MRHGRALSAGGLALAVAAFLAVNVGARHLLRAARVDLTQNRLHTLSAGTRNILHGLEKDVTLRFFWSPRAAEDLPGLSHYARTVQDLLAEYAALSGGRLRLDVVNPEPFSEAEDDAVRYGLQGVPVSPGADPLYFGLLGLGPDGATQVIPFFQPERERFLEYDVSRLVHSLAHPGRTVVGLLTALPMDGTPHLGRFGGGFGMEPPWMVLESLRQEYDVRPLPASTSVIPEGLGALLVVDPHGLPAAAVYAVDQFVLRGGRALVFVDPVSEARGEQSPGAALSSPGPADSLLGGWGVALEPGKVVGDLERSQRVSFTDRGRVQIVNYIPWLSLRDDLINREEVSTLQLGAVNLASAGALRALEGASTRMHPLLRSSGSATLIDAAGVAFSPDPRKLLAEYTPGAGSFVLAARLSGPARSGFAAPPAPAEGSEAGQLPSHVSEAAAPVNVVVVADADLLQDRFWVEVRNFFGRRVAIPSADNGALVVNILDQLAGSPDLIGIRSRAGADRPFDLLERIALQAQMEYRAKEEELTARLQETDRKLSELDVQPKGEDVTEPTPEQAAELERFRQEKVRIRSELRDVQYRLRRDIDRLGAWLKFVNIALVPLLVATGSVGVWLLRRNRSRRFPT